MVNVQGKQKLVVMEVDKILRETWILLVISEKATVFVFE